MVYVLSHTGSALMPTQRHGKVRRLLCDGLAHVITRTPFTIQLDYESTEFTQPVTLGVDAGSTHVGLSATTDTKELFSAEMTLRTDIAKLLSQRLESRRNRRSRLRYRAPRFDNRRRAEGTLAPSVENRVQTHLRLIGKVRSILPVTRTVIEVAQFDQQLLKNPDISGKQYQQGEQMGSWNTREYILCRDGHKCQHCKGKSKDPILNVHHIESRQTGGDAPNNLITLCETCHKAYHKGEIQLKVKRGTSLRDVAVMNIMRWELYRRAKALWQDVSLTYGYITKHTRIHAGLEKSHRIDARCISGHPTARPAEHWFRMRQVRRHDRSLHVFTPAKGGRRRSASASHWIGKSKLQRYDTIRWNGITAFISGSTNGRPILRDIDWKLITSTASINPKTITFITRRHGSLLTKKIGKTLNNHIMKKTMMIIVALIGFAFNASAQFSEDLRTIEVGLHSTTHVLFTSDLTYVNITRPQEVKTMIVPASKNMLALTALVEFNIPTTFSVLEANGNIHTFLLKYNRFPAELLVDTRENAENVAGQMNTQIRPSAKASVVDTTKAEISKPTKKSKGVMNVASSQTSNFSRIDAPTLEEVVNSPQKVFHIGDKNFNIEAFCTNVYVYSDLIYLVVSIENKSDIGYEAGDAQFTIETRTKKKQYLESDKDVWAKSTFGTLSCAPKGKSVIGFTIPKFTLLKRECLRVYIYEKSGNRNLVLTLNEKDINYAQAFSK